MADYTYPKIYLYRRIVQAKLFMDTHFADKLDIDSISDEAFFSKFHFIRQFKTIYGKTPHQYLTYVRLENAKEVLKLDKPVAEACFSVGFDSISSFTGLFKRSMGMPPAQYQRQQRQLKTEIASTPLKFIPNCFAESKGWTKKIPLQLKKAILKKSE